MIWVCTADYLPKLQKELVISCIICFVSKFNFSGEIISASFDGAWQKRGYRYYSGRCYNSLTEPVREKTNNLGSDQVQHKPDCTVTEDG